MNKTKKILSALAVVSMVAYAASPVLATGTTIVVTGNGPGTANYADVNQTSTTNVTQNNVAKVTNTVDADATSGKNDASFNSGGMVTVAAGAATTNVDVTNVLNKNTADVTCCGVGSADVEISDNVAGSKNTIDLDLANRVNVNQDNMAGVLNDVDADATSGYNRAMGNTGSDGMVTVTSGPATTDVNVATLANVNSAVVHPATPGGSSVSAVITGNGPATVNWIQLDIAKSTRLAQDNVARIVNDVESEALSGHNAGNYNAGADVLVASGPASANAAVLNSVNFNHIESDCGCGYDVFAKIADNVGGYPYPYPNPMPHGDSLMNESLSTMGMGMPYWYLPASTNTILANLSSTQAYAQDNMAGLNNLLDDVKAKSGYNSSTANTGSHGGDPIVVSGAASSNATVVNEGNENVIGTMPWASWPWVDSMPALDLSMNFSSVWAVLWGGLIG